MGIRNRQIGWSNESNLLYDILLQFCKIRQNINFTTSTTTTCTALNQPNPITLTNPTDLTLDFIFNYVDGNNDPLTLYSIQETVTGLYLIFDNGGWVLASYTPVYYTKAQIQNFLSISSTIFLLFPDTTYTFEVIAMNTCQDTLTSNSANGTTGTFTSPDPYFYYDRYDYPLGNICVGDSVEKYIFFTGGNLNGTNVLIEALDGTISPGLEIQISLDGINWQSTITFSGYGTQIPLTKIYFKVIGTGFGLRNLTIKASGGNIIGLEIFNTPDYNAIIC